MNTTRIRELVDAFFGGRNAIGRDAAFDLVRTTVREAEDDIKRDMKERLSSRLLGID
jgi:hypothetical protein